MAITYYDLVYFQGRTLMEWALIWLRTSNDAFFATYKFNFNPHDYPGLYEAARIKMYGK